MTARKKSQPQADLTLPILEAMPGAAALVCPGGTFRAVNRKWLLKWPVPLGGAVCDWIAAGWPSCGAQAAEALDRLQNGKIAAFEAELRPEGRGDARSLRLHMSLLEGSDHCLLTLTENTVPDDGFWLQFAGSLDEAVVVWSLPAGTVCYENARGVAFFEGRFTGPAHEDDWTGLVHPEDHPAYDRLRERLARDGHASETIRIHRLDGGVRWLELRFRKQVESWSDDGGIQSGYLILVARDTTEKEQARIGLEQSEARFRELCDAIPGAVFVADLGNPPVFMSDGIEAMTGFPPERFYEPGFVDSRIHPEDIPQLLKRWESDANRPIEFELRFLHADGNYRWLHSRYQLRGAGTPGSGLLAFGHNMDVTAQKQAEERLRVLSSLIENATIMAFRSSGSGELLFTNRALQQRLGYSAEELSGMKVWELSPDPLAAKRVRPDRWQRMLEHGSATEEVIFRTKSGEEFPVELHANLESRSPDPVAIAFATDLTERKRTEERLRNLSRTMDSVAAIRRNLLRLNASDEILQTACESVLENGHYSMAWFGIGEDSPGKPVRVVAVAGDTTAYTKTLRVTWGDDEFGRGPAGTAIREHRSIRSALDSDPAFAPWRARALASGFVCGCSIPVQLGTAEWGVLCVYSNDSTRFGPEELELLERVGDDIVHVRQRLQAEARLQEAQSRLLSVMRAIDTNLILLDREGHLLFSNRDYDPDRYLEGGGFWQGLSPESAARVLAARAEVFAGNAMKMELDQIVAGGQRRAAVHIQPVWIAGEVQQAVVSSRDITQERKAALALAQSEEKFRAIFESDAAAVYLLDGTTLQLVDANRRAVRDSGRADVADLRDHPEFGAEPYGPEGMRDLVLRTLEEGTQTTEWLLQPPGREGIWYQVHFQRLDTTSGSFALAVAVDITARKQVQEKLRQLNADLEAMVRERTEQVQLQAAAMDASVDGVAILQDGTYIYMNETFARTFGYDREEMRGKSWTLTYSPEEQQRAETEIWPVVLETGHWTGELKWRCKDGSDKWGEGSLALLPGGHTIATCLEMTPRLAAQAAMRRSRDELAAANLALERAIHLKDDFLANMSHELRTPLTGIMGMCEVLRYDLSENMTSRQMEALDVMQSGGEHLLALINDVLDLSKIEAGRMALELSVEASQLLVSQSVEMVRALADKKQQKITVEDQSGGFEIEVDERRFRQALINLLSNAIKFSPPGGEIQVTTRLDVPTGLARYRVSDHGPGIAPEHQRLLFRPFVQADNSLTRSHSGTGLGLSMARRIMELHGGGVILETVPGEGSSFELVLPVRQLLVSALEPARSRPRAVNSRALFVDFGGRSIARYRDSLTAHGFEVLSGRGGLDIPTVCAEMQPRVLVLDVDGSESEAVDFARHVLSRKWPGGGQIVAALTSVQVPANRQFSEMAGFDWVWLVPEALGQLLSEAGSTSAGMD